jgi:hemimethylated DNA binding protein
MASSHPSRSKLVENETILLVFQLDLDIQLQRCLNYESYELAKEVRAKRQQVDEAIEGIKTRKQLQRSKIEGGEATPSTGKTLLPSDISAEGLRLRMEMQRAVEGENYKEAARLRDLISALDLERKKAEDSLSASNPSFRVEPSLRLGQRVKHKVGGFRAVVVGWDQLCCESDEWIASQSWKGETPGPFYHLIVDARDWQDGEEAMGLPPMAYVPQTLLSAPEIDEPVVTDEAEMQDPDAKAQVKSWNETYGDDPLQHPFSSTLFLGQDAKGDYIPCRKLRDKYNLPRGPWNV